MLNYDLHSKPTPAKAMRRGAGSFKKQGPLGSTIVSILLSSISAASFAAGYNIAEIPVPKITIPAGTTARPVCLGVNEFGQVACNLEIIQTLARSPVDRLAPIPKKFASYAYAWDSKTKALTLLSPVAATTFDRVNAISDTGFLGGSTGIVNTPSTAAIWTLALKASSLFGLGEITDINNPGDFVLNKQLFVSNKAVSFAGKNVRVDAINNPSPTTHQVLAAGAQALDKPVKTSGIGLLYPVAPANPIYALPGSQSGFSVSGLSDNGNLVISGTPNTISALVTLSCTATSSCQFYFPTVTAAGRGKPYIRLDSVNNTRLAVGTDGGFALLVNPPTATTPNGKTVDLNSQLPAGSFSTLGIFLNEATAINNSGQIVAIGSKAGGKLAAFLLTPTP